MRNTTQPAIGSAARNAHCVAHDRSSQPLSESPAKQVRARSSPLLPMDENAPMTTRRSLIASIPALVPLSASAGEQMSSTAQEAQHLVDRYAAAWLRGDTAEAIACYHDDFTLHYFGRNALSGDHVGKAAALQTLQQVARRTGWRVTQIKSTLSAPGRAAIIARVAYKVGAGLVERDRVLIFAIADGLLRECWAYDEDQALLDELLGQRSAQQARGDDA
jgi:uncharacterized protein